MFRDGDVGGRVAEAAGAGAASKVGGDKESEGLWLRRGLSFGWGEDFSRGESGEEGYDQDYKEGFDNNILLVKEVVKEIADFVKEVHKYVCLRG